MRVRVLFFGVLRELASKASEEIELPEGASVRDLISHYESGLPQLRASLGSIALAVNQQYAPPDTKLSSGDEVALLPPVSGGATKDTPVVKLVRDRIVPHDVIPRLEKPEDGAIVIFDGVVRDNSRGRRTLYLDYDCYEAMALRQLQDLALEALKNFAIRNVAIVHRLGRIEIGDSSVLIAVFSAHRAAAFEACRWLIDTLKRKVPIWKKEYFEDGAVWADGEAFPAEIPRAKS